jgi:hypothetical protein
MTQNERHLTWLSGLKWELIEAFSKVQNFDVSRRANTKKISKLSSLTLSLLIFLVFRRRRTSKVQLLKKLQKVLLSDLIITSNVARFESFLQDSKALDQLNKLRNFFWNHAICALRVQRACEWCKDFCFTKSSFLIWLADVNVSGEWCQCIRRVMSSYQRVMSVYHYPKLNDNNRETRIKLKIEVKFAKRWRKTFRAKNWRYTKHCWSLKMLSLRICKQNA